MELTALSSGYPIRQYIVKVHSRCDLACDHCYVYEHADQSWRGRPRAMAIETVRAGAARIAEHARAHGLKRITVVLHGGEPLLLGRDRLAATVAELRRIIEPAARLDLRMQTNGVLLSEALCDVFVDYDVRLGISLDGDHVANDRHRRFANGASSYRQVLNALELLRRPRYRRQYAGILCTIDIRNDPIAVYRALAAQQPPRLDLLLPHATWDHPPLRPNDEPAPYAQWLLDIYDTWVADGRPMSIRLFESLRSTAAGGPSHNEWIGLDPADLVVIETDGAWEQVDSLKTTFEGAPATGLNVVDHSVDEVARMPEIARRQQGLTDLAPTCRDCPVVHQCGGGLFAHRYRTGAGFTNPSAYCSDLLGLIMSINERLSAESGHPAQPASGQPASARPAALASTPDALPPGLLEQVGSGAATASDVEYLAETQLSITRALTAALASGGSELAKSGWQTLTQLDRTHRQAVHAVMGHPYLRVWAVDALKRADLGQHEASGYLGCIAAAAALRGGAVVRVEVPVNGGMIHLPSMGTISLPTAVTGMAELTIGTGPSAGPSAGPAAEPTVGATITVRSGSDRLVVHPHNQPETAAPVGGEPGWQPSRWITAGDLHLLLEDLDPYRDCHDWKADTRLSPERADAWEHAIARAWQLIQHEAPSQVPAMRAGFRAVAPLGSDPEGLLRSSTARHAFGSVGAAIASDDRLCVMLVHEFQHTILGALLDLCELYDPNDRRHLKVAWRSDKRPIEGVLQGTFAHLAVTRIWRLRAQRGSADAQTISTYRQYREWTASAVNLLIDSGALTPAGVTFVRSMAAALDAV